MDREFQRVIEIFVWIALGGIGWQNSSILSRCLSSQAVAFFPWCTFKLSRIRKTFRLEVRTSRSTNWIRRCWFMESSYSIKRMSPCLLRAENIFSPSLFVSTGRIGGCPLGANPRSQFEQLSIPVSSPQ